MQKEFIKIFEEPCRRPLSLKVYEYVLHYYSSSKPFGIADIGGKYLEAGLKKIRFPALYCHTTLMRQLSNICPIKIPF